MLRRGSLSINSAICVFIKQNVKNRMFVCKNFKKSEGNRVLK